jgi:hypothetical protein
MNIKRRYRQVRLSNEFGWKNGPAAVVHTREQFEQVGSAVGSGKLTLMARTLITVFPEPGLFVIAGPRISDMGVRAACHGILGPTETK